MPKQKTKFNSSGFINLKSISKFKPKTKKQLGILLIAVLLLASLSVVLYNQHTTNKTNTLTASSVEPTSSAQSTTNSSAQNQTSTPTNSSSTGTTQPKTSGSSGGAASTPSSSSSSDGQSGGSTPTPPSPTVTAETLGVDHTSGSASCGQSYTYNFSGTITANGPGTITYHWFATDKGDSGPLSLTFSAAGTLGVTKSLTYNGSDYGGGQSYPMTMRLESLTPNSVSKLQNFDFTSTCI